MATLSFILSIVAILGVIGVVISQVMLGRNLAKHVDELKATLQALKEGLEKQISDVEEKIDAHSKGQSQWENSFRAWVQEQLKAQATKYELHVKGIHEALERIGNTRENIATEVERFVRVLVAALKGEKALFEELTKMAASQPSPDQPTEADATDQGPKE